MNRSIPPLLLASLALSSTSCRTRLVDFPDCVVEVTQKKVETSCRQDEKTRKVDLLFMIDNSTSMLAMQDELRARFPAFLKVLHDLDASGELIDLHLGVVTSDYGAGRSGSGNCEPSPGGQKGRLQAIGQFAGANCKPPVGANYLQYTFGRGDSGPNNLPPGQSLDETFTCMASVGARGCGAEHQLESVRAALQDDIPDNKGFLRDDALLAVVFVTNEDDCSAPPSSDLFGPDQTAKYGPNESFRCTRYGVLCGNPPSQPPLESSGPLDQCVAAPNPDGTGPGKLFDIGRYVNAFTHDIKFDPTDVLLVAIDAPEKPFEVIEADSSTGNDGKPYVECGLGNPNVGQCLPTLQHSCQNMSNGAFFGDPAVRLNEVVSSAQNHRIASICDTDFTKPLENLANLIVSQLGECCLPDSLPADPRAPDDPTQFMADCQVRETTRHPDGTATIVEIPRCTLGGGFPCWQVQPKTSCASLSPQSAGLTIERDGVAPLPHTTVQAKCAGTMN